MAVKNITPSHEKLHYLLQLFLLLAHIINQSSNQE